MVEHNADGPDCLFGHIPLPATGRDKAHRSALAILPAPPAATDTARGATAGVNGAGSIATAVRAGGSIVL